MAVAMKYILKVEKTWFHISILNEFALKIHDFTKLKLIVYLKKFQIL